MQTERFEKLRKKALKEAFQKKRIIWIWRNIVKSQLRQQSIQDLYDYYDLNFNIDERAVNIRNSVLSGTYKASPALIYRLEKKLGICRHMVIPQPVDALVLQVLTEYIIEGVLKNQPSKNAFYSRSRDNITRPHDISEYGLTLGELWQKLQKKIYKFSTEKDLIVTTDLSNYYDSIDINELKKVLSGYIKTNEVIPDLLFAIIQDVSWHPDYLPYSGRGLPTSNLEGIRLLAHCFLYEIDQVLKDKSGNCFTRWMDDIVIGVDTQKEAKEVVSSVSDMLKSRGLALNIAKTNIYNTDDAFFHFQINENQYLSSIAVIPKSDPEYPSLIAELRVNFNTHQNSTKAKYWDKVTKRYITLFGKLESKEILNEVPFLYVNYPSLRTHLLNYLLNLGYDSETSKKVLDIVNELDLFDDISLYEVCKLITDWEIPEDTKAKSFLKKFEKTIMLISFKRKSSSDFYSLLWFKAKYSKPKELLNFLTKYKNIWQLDSFLKRQTTAILSRLYLTNKILVKQMLVSVSSSGDTSSVSLANQILFFLEAKIIDSKINFYLFPQHSQKVFPLSKFLVLCSVLNSDAIRINPVMIEKILKNIKDPYYKKWIEDYFLFNSR